MALSAEARNAKIHTLLADALTKKGWLVKDIISTSAAKKHRLTPFLKVRKGQLIYPEVKSNKIK